jgi:hypothetical protein
LTPLIRYFSQFTPDGHWFDLGRLDRDHGFELDPERLCHLPYEQTMITFIDADGHWACIRASFTGETVAIAGLVVYQNKTQSIAPYAYLSTDEGLRLIPAPGYPLPDREDVLRSLAVVDLLLSRLEAPQVCYHRERKTTGLARIKKKPMLEWKVLRVEPRSKSEEHGGTHASPRAHDRRGHWRSLPTGRKVWVKQCRVGDPDNGVVLKDYLVR